MDAKISGDPLVAVALNRTGGPRLLAYGRAPLFTYELHIYVVHGSALLVAVLAGYPAAYEANFLADPFRIYKAGWGFNLAIVYLAWLAILIAIYPPARWFAEVKRRRRDWWLSYLQTGSGPWLQ